VVKDQYEIIIILMYNRVICFNVVSNVFSHSLFFEYPRDMNNGIEILMNALCNLFLSNFIRSAPCMINNLS
jgi:hypothetical protein